MPEIVFADGGGHEFGKQVGGASEGGNAQRGQFGGDAVIVCGRALVVERQEYDELHAGRLDGSATAEEFAGVAAFEQVADENEYGIGGLPDQRLAISQGFVDVGAAAQLRGEEQLYRILEVLAEVNDGGVEDG